LFEAKERLKERLKDDNLSYEERDEILKDKKDLDASKKDFYRFEHVKRTIKAFTQELEDVKAERIRLENHLDRSPEEIVVESRFPLNAAYHFQGETQTLSQWAK
jgi:uncharacterized protein (DUF342 family)